MSVSASFSGSVPQNYDTYMGPVMFEPYAVETARRVPVAKDVLEIAAGTGRVTAHLAAKLPEGGRLVASDLNNDMLEVARKRISHPGVVFDVADAHALPYKDGEFDQIICQYAAMFFKDRIQAFSEFRRVLKPDGTMWMTVWGSMEQNAWVGAAQESANHFLPEDKKINVLFVPYSYNDEAQIESDLKEAGWKDVAFEWVEKEFRVESPSEYLKGVFQGSPLTAALADRGVEDMTPMMEMAERQLIERFGNPVVTSMWTLYIEAKG
ncbi:MAG: class I SAM-dependent methyltransferase [Armatimonadetes bacterium]|nr:class I SAM-dependent methyltransferase [Armatimonadota bacterium]